MPKRLDDKRILAAYEQWDERNEPVDAFCKRMDLSKQSLYAVLRRNDVVPKTRRISAESTQGMLTKVLADLDQIKAALNIGERPVNGDRYNAGPGTDNRPVSAVRLRRRRRAPVSATPPIGDHESGHPSSDPNTDRSDPPGESAAWSERTPQCHA